MSTRPALEAALATARATVSAIEAALAALDSGTTEAELLDLGALKERYELGRAAIVAAVGRGELQAVRGGRGRILVSDNDVRAWLATRPVTPRKVERGAEITTLADWEAADDLALARARRRPA